MRNTLAEALLLREIPASLEFFIFKFFISSTRFSIFIPTIVFQAAFASFLKIALPKPAVDISARFLSATFLKRSA